MTGQSIVPNFVLSQGAKDRLKRGENASATAVMVNMHARGKTPPITSATLDTSAEVERYPLVVGADGAKMYVPFEETSGLTVYDAVTLANTGLYDSSVVHIAGPVVLQLPALDHAITTTVDDSVVIGSPIPVGPGTWEIWVRTSEVVGSPTVIGHLTTDPGSADPVITDKITLNADGTLTAGRYDAADALQYSDGHPTAVNDGDWHHIAAVDSDTTMLLYVDGSLT